jgi:hypothetical protein
MQELTTKVKTNRPGRFEEVVFKRNARVYPELLINLVQEFLTDHPFLHMCKENKIL